MTNNKKQNQPAPLSDFEHTLLRMSIRYACHRQTIASASLPASIVLNWWSRISDTKKRTIYEDLQRELEFSKTSNGEPKFGSDCDNHAWQKFMSACNIDSYEVITLTDDSEVTVFRSGGVIYPLDKYTQNPWIDCYIPEENIKKGK